MKPELFWFGVIGSGACRGRISNERKLRASHVLVSQITRMAADDRGSHEA